jgi:hypothetical protein
MNIGLVAACSQMLAVPAPARLLYVSPLFVKASRYASRAYPAWFILSAAHGLLDPDSVVTPVNFALTRLHKEDRHVWGIRVFEQLKRRGIEDETFVLHAGGDFAEALSGFLTIVQPLWGMSIGQQLQWYNEELREFATDDGT